eukprot:1564848-Prymnesium_polylepis.1
MTAASSRSAPASASTQHSATEAHWPSKSASSRVGQTNSPLPPQTARRKSDGGGWFEPRVRIR